MQILNRTSNGSRLEGRDDEDFRHPGLRAGVHFKCGAEARFVGESWPIVQSKPDAGAEQGHDLAPVTLGLGTDLVEDFGESLALHLR